MIRYTKVVGQDTHKLFDSKEDAIKHFGTDENIFAVVYPAEWASFSEGSTKRENGNTFIKRLDAKEFEQCFILGVDVSYPTKEEGNL